MSGTLFRAWAAFDAGAVHSALLQVKRHLHRDSDDGRGWELMGLIQHRRGRYRRAVSALERASCLVPLRPAARVALAHAYGQTGHVMLARELFHLHTEDDQLSAEMLLQIAAGLEELHDAAGALRVCRLATVREPELAQAYYDMGFYAGLCGYPPQMTESLALKAIDLDPDRACFRIGLAGLRLQMGRDRDAYELVRCFTQDQVNEICCDSCLKRILGLWEAAGDQQRVEWAEARLQELVVEQVSGKNGSQGGE